MQTTVPSTPFALRSGTVALILVAILAVYGVDTHARRRAIPSPATLADQGAYLGYARHLYETNYTIIEDRNRMPVFPFLLSLIYRPGLSGEDFLNRAQVFNVNLSIALLGLLFFVFRRFFAPLPSLGLVAATGFGVFIYRAPTLQTEVVFYFISFCGFVLLLRMLVAPGWWLALVAGATMGVAHLTKASVLPALLAWAAAFSVAILGRARSDGTANMARKAGMLVLVLASFLAVVFPYIQTSKRIYGSYFYNVNSTFVMWCDSSTEAFEFLNAHDKDDWRRVPPEQRPSPGKFWREHTVAQIVTRIFHGVRRVVTQNAMLIGYYKFTVALAVAGIVLGFRQRERVWQMLTANAGAVIFCLLYFGGYLLLYGWYDRIVNDSRFVLAIFLPFLFVAALFVYRLGGDRIIALAGRRWRFPEFFFVLLGSFAVIDVIYNARYLLR